jgi:hypothetical protein
MFERKEDKMGAFIFCNYFVGANKFISSIDTWGNKPDEWYRVFRFYKGFHWDRHEPPTLLDEKGVDRGRQRPFIRKETMANGISFQHFAYAIPEQILFKEIYYGYKDALKYWNKLQNTNGKLVDVGDYLPWASKGALVETWDEKKDGKLLYPSGCV